MLNLERDIFYFFLCVEGTSSLLSLVKTLDSVLAVYEGFCNLKQVRFASFIFSLFGCRENNYTNRCVFETELTEFVVLFLIFRLILN